MGVLTSFSRVARFPALTVTIRRRKSAILDISQAAGQNSRSSNTFGHFHRVTPVPSSQVFTFYLAGASAACWARLHVLAAAHGRPCQASAAQLARRMVVVSAAAQVTRPIRRGPVRVGPYPHVL